MYSLRRFKCRASATCRIMGYADKPAVPVGAITFLHEWVKEQLYDRRKDFTSKYTEKGNIMEQGAIELAAEEYGWGLVTKNTKRYENDWQTGMPDLVLQDLVPDLKNSWDCFTFPLFAKMDNDYEWQMQSYMDLTGRDRAAVIYCLMDAPDSLVEAEARKEMYRQGKSELEMELYDKVKASMTYSHLPNILRVRRFDVYRDEKKIKQIHDRVAMCADYIDELRVHEKTIEEVLKIINSN